MVQISIPTATAVAVVALAAAPAIAAPIPAGEQVEARAIRRPSAASVRHGASRTLDHVGNIAGVVGVVQGFTQRDLSDEGLEARGGVPPGIGRAAKNVFRHVAGRFRHGPRDLEDVEARDVDDEGLEARGGVPTGIGRAVKNVGRHVVGRLRHGPRDLEDVEARDVDEDLEMRDFEELEDLFEREYEMDEMD
ncbi:hypothetical protein DFP72DRAFT_843456 [Ephemerocybe angulata]|uniref:Uncharacterized protein n=1 Tax=Ephemerocybe angulata TaxID=980116 RepID=A0A8H6IA34_9AGAR|nr:hypothetical protein DFP72DRAFT_843456 [Tulosesus angulatus]